jgi:hypothetical protein
MSNDQITKEQARKILEAYFLKRAIETAKHTARVATFTEQNPGAYMHTNDACWWTSGMPCEHTNFMIGASRMIGISKITGEICFDGMCGE